MSSKRHTQNVDTVSPIDLGSLAPGGPDVVAPDALVCSPPIVDEQLPKYSPRASGVGRVIDVGIAMLMFAIGLIPSLMIALLVKMSSTGPVFFTQDRVGRDGAVFKLYKFRTMAQGTDQEVLGDDDLRAAYEENDFKLPSDDPRITAVGRFLRKTSVDELPQLINVLRGEMSVVGVRPLLPRELLLRPAHDQVLYRMRRPGLTGLWQVEGRSSVGGADRLELDRRYLEEWSVLGDLRIMIRTPLALVRIHHAH